MLNAFLFRSKQNKVKEEKKADSIARLMADMKVSKSGTPEEKKKKDLEDFLAVGEDEEDEEDDDDDGEVIDPSECFSHARRE